MGELPGARPESRVIAPTVNLREPVERHLDPAELGAPGELRLGVLAGLRDRHGSPAGHLEHHGLSTEDRDALPAALVAPDR